MVRLSKQARRRLVSNRRPKIKTGAVGSCSSCSCKTKAKKTDVRLHENALSGELAASTFVPKMASAKK